MATATELLRLVIDADGRGAIQGLERVGAASDRELGRADDKLKKVGASLTSFGATAVTAAGVASVGLFKLADAASAYGEQVSAATKIFGEQSVGALEDFAEAASDTAGVSKTLALQVSNNFGTLGKQAGFTGGELIKFSTTLTQLGGDLASFKDTTVEEALQAIQSGLQGESEPLRRYGVFLNDAKLKAEAFAQGIYDGSGALNEQQKIAAAYNIILKETTDAQGDFVDTSDSLANRQRQLKAEFENVKVEVGNGLVPVFETLLGAVGGITGQFSQLSPEAQKLTGSIAGFATAGVAAAGGLALVAGGVLRSVDTFRELGSRLRTADGQLNAVGRSAKAASIGLGALAAIEVGRALERATADVKGFDTAIKGLSDSDSASDLAAGLQEAASATEGLFDRLTNSVPFGNKSLLDPAILVGPQQLRVEVDNLTDVLDRLVEEGRTDELRRLLTLLGSGVSFPDIGADQEKLNTILAGYRDNLAATDQEQRDAAESSGKLKGAVEQGTTPFETLAAAVDEGTASLQDYKKALDAAFDPTEAYFGAIDDGKQSQIDILEATKEVQDLFKFGATNTQEFRDAQQRLADANQSYFDSLRDQEGALADFAEANGTSTQQVQAAKDQIDRYVFSGQLSVEQGQKMKDQLDFVAVAAANAKNQYEGLNGQIAIFNEQAGKVPTGEQVLQRQGRAGPEDFGGLADGGRSVGGSFGNRSSGPVARPRAMGGPVSANNPYLVGERGPELFVPNASGSILPNGAMGAGINIGSLTINGVEPERTAIATVRRMRDETYLAVTG